MSTTTQSGYRQLRKGRFNITGHYYFLSTVTAQRRKLFQQYPETARTVINSARYLREEGTFDFKAVMVMPDHVHLAGRLLEDPLATVMNRLKSFTAHQIIRQTGMTHAVWQAGYHDHALRQEEDYRRSLAYLLENPVRAGLVLDFHHYPHWWCEYDV